MRIAFIFSRDQLTANEARLVRAAACAPGVTTVVVVAVVAKAVAVRVFERVRANIERGVARQWHPLIPLQQLSDCASVERVANNGEAVRGHEPFDRVWNLSGCEQPGAGTALVFELQHDERQPDGLGEYAAGAEPAADVAVIVRSPSGVRCVCEFSRLTRTAETPAADRRNAASRSAVLLLRTLARDADSLLGGLPESASVMAVRTPAAVRITHAVAASARTIVQALVRRASRFVVSRESWDIGYRTDPRLFTTQQRSFTARGFRRYRLTFERAVADPMPFAHNGIRAVFFEEIAPGKSHGVISCAVLQPSGLLGDAVCVLQKSYHLSYPFVFRERQRIYMVPESSANRTIDLYECTSFPHVWEFRCTLIADIVATDATLYHDGRRWWMFCTVSAFGEYTWDELHLFYSDALTDPWTPHPSNPVKRDARSARPAGPLFWRDGRLMRPTQDCSASYGRAINLCEVEELTPTGFRERVVERIDPAMFRDAAGIHTLAAADGIEVVDVRRHCRWRWERDKPDAGAGTPAPPHE
ncbi:MAG: glucosamine inositolphosphorylceramide transferase family protein [Gemmatimonas sp.]